MELLALIRTRYNTLSKTQKIVADYVLENPDKVITHSIKALADICETSEATVMRFLKKLDIDSYQVFRVMVAQEYSRGQEKVYGDVEDTDDIGSIKEKIISETKYSIEDLKNLLDDLDLEKFIDSLLGAEKIIFIGVGASGFIGADFNHKILRLGLNSEFYSDSHIMSIRVIQGNENEVLVPISHSGESKEILDTVKMAKDKGMKVCSITSHQNSSLSYLSDISLYSSSKETSYRSDAMTSRILQFIIIDIISVGVTLRLEDIGIKNINASRLAVANKKK